MNRMFVMMLAVGLGLGCTKESSAPPKVEAAKPPPVELRNADGKLTRAGVDAAWDTIFLSSATMSDPAEKKIAALEARLGAPAKIEEGKRVWWAFEGSTCFRVELAPDGLKSVEKIFQPELCEQ